MADFSIDRSRLVAGVDKLIEKLNGEDEWPDDAKIDTFMIIAIVDATDEDGDEEELPVSWCESSRPHVKVGIMQTALAQQLNEY